MVNLFSRRKRNGNLRVNTGIPSVMSPVSDLSAPIHKAKTARRNQEVERKESAPRLTTDARTDGRPSADCVSALQPQKKEFVVFHNRFGGSLLH
jgi:hypothetical protein